MRITIIAVGKRHDSYVKAGIEDFSKRLNRYITLEWLLIPHSGQEEVVARKSESEIILSKISTQSTVVLLDERGVLLDSPALALQIEQWQLSSKPVVLIIGGAYGVSDELQSRADYTWSLSPLVFPHQLVRLILSEHLYRALTIIKGEPYHHS